METKIKDLTKTIDIMTKQKENMTFEEKWEKGLVNLEGYDFSALNEKEKGYWKQMYPKSGVLFLTSKPGIAKSAMQRSLAKKIKRVEIVIDAKGNVDVQKSGKIIGNSMFYIDLRLAMLDETDVGLFPNKQEMTVTEHGKDVVRAFLDHIVPKWAFFANNRPVKNNGKLEHKIAVKLKKFQEDEDSLTSDEKKSRKKELEKLEYELELEKLPYAGSIIHFEELNRAPLAVRNAALQILLERCIGFEFEFNDDVFMVSTGNLGDEDGTDVEEFDSALKGRLIHQEHTLDFSEWVKYFAEENIQSIIIDYLTNHQDNYYVKIDQRADKQENAYASPRTWTFLSDYITKNYGFNSHAQKWIHDISIIGHGYIGSANTAFVRYVNDILRISIQDIMDRFPQLQAEGVSFTRDKKSELLADLKKVDFKKLKANQIENIKLFMLSIGEDEISAFIIKLLDDEYHLEDDKSTDKEKNAFIIGFLKDPRFTKYQEVLYNHVQTDKAKVEDDKW